MSDLDIIKQIEKELGVTLKETGEIELAFAFALELGESCYTTDTQGKVEGLSCYGCNIKDLNRIALQLKSLTNLTWLNLSSNQINDLEGIKSLTNLTWLYLSSNQISDLEGIKDLTNLVLLDLTDNPIDALPRWIADFHLELKWDSGWKDGFIYFYDNPLKNPPVEIVKQGKEAVKNYFEQLEIQGKDEIYEAKLMIVGEPGSGKTTLMNKLFDRDFSVPNEKTESTVGIEVRPNWEFAIGSEKDFKAHIWDFGRATDSVHAAPVFPYIRLPLYING